ncbi:hypothetical protein GYA54_00150 [Candidatus Kuenenbacteria bacterium]|nr:hypothetical protein [Candidatus Kuenenbacteria bacterium]
MKKIVFLILTITLMSVLVLPVLAGEHATTSTSTPPAWGLKKKTAETTDWACVKTAVAKRESAVFSAYSIKSDAIKVALNNKKAALNEAYGKTDSKERIKARIKAWADYKLAVKNTNKVYRDAVNAAWKQYKTDRKACKLNVEMEPVGLELSL